MTSFLSQLKRSGASVLAGLALFMVLAVSTAPSVWAHGGEVHGDEEPVTSSAIGPRMESHSDLFELVAIPSARDGGTLAVYLQEFWTNGVVENATVELTAADETITGFFDKGVYRFRTPWVLKPGAYDLTFAITAGDQSDLLIGRLDIPEPPPAAAAHDTLWDHIWPQSWQIGSLPLWVPLSALTLAALLSLSAMRLPRPLRSLTLLGAAIMGLSSMAVAATLLSGAEQSGEIGSAASLLDRPEAAQRLENRTIFMPKPAQALMGVATAQTAQTETVAKSVRLIGQVIPDPNHSGLVQALLAGRIEAPEGGFPALGSAVKKGDLLGYLVPRVEVVDQSDIRQTQGDLDRQIELAEAKLRRLEPLKYGIVPESQIIDARIELEALRKRRATIRPVLADREALIAPADGFLAQANVVAGQVVEAQSILFQIVDPAHLMIEALAFDSETAAKIERGAKDALATTADGRMVALQHVGRALALRQQAVPLRFKVVSKDAAINVGEPITVTASINETLSALPVPRASIVRAANGQSIVWAHVEAERFEPRVVQSAPLDSQRVGITSGLKPGARIVVRGAELINQVR
jgi:cobalt-zinc-cadmium efflux system membrane fusion protein